MASFYHMNQTSLETSELPVLPDKAQVFLHQYGPAIELLLMLPMYLKFYTSTAGFLRGFPSSKKGAVIGFPPRTLIAHILISLIAPVRYYFRHLFAEPSANLVDLALGMAQITSAWLMCKWTPSKSPLAKASFQTMALMIAIPVITAYVTGSSQWHRTNVKCIEWFVTYRWIALAIQKYHIYDTPKVDGDAIVHLVSVPITLWLANWMWAIPLYLVATPVMIQLEEWVTMQIPHNQAERTGVAGVLATLGFCELATNKPPSSKTGKNQ